MLPCGLAGFVEKAEEIKSKGVDTIACISVNGEHNSASDPVLPSQNNIIQTTDRFLHLCCVVW